MKVEFGSLEKSISTNSLIRLKNPFCSIVHAQSSILNGRLQFNTSEIVVIKDFS